MKSVILIIVACVLSGCTSEVEIKERATQSRIVDLKARATNMLYYRDPKTGLVYGVTNSSYAGGNLVLIPKDQEHRVEPYLIKD